MKVFEIVTPKNFTPQKLMTPAAAKYREMLKDTRNGRSLSGEGSYANVYSNDADPGGVDKVAKPISPKDHGGQLIDGLEDDAYYKYLKLITTNERFSNNPYFPRVYNLKTYKGNDGRYTYEVNLEKLQKLVTLSTKEAKMLGHNLFTDYDDQVNITKEELIPGGMKTDDKRLVDQILHRIHLEAISELIQKAIQNNGEPTAHVNIKDAKFKQALTLIRGLIKKNHPHMTNDAHVGNIMVRRGPFTPQLVLTDPVS